MRKALAKLICGALWITGKNPISNYDPKKPRPLASNASEDCLTLNVETPSVSESSLFPVMVWIHGGAFQMGAGSQYIYHPRESPIARQGIVLVTINYRLGLLGFAKVDGGDYNCGIWDQIAALQWVQDNIRSFGGDPNNVTIFGESAGGMSVATLTATRYAGKLFHGAICQSGSAQVGICKQDAAWLAEDVAKTLEVPSCSIASLQNVSAAALLATQTEVVRANRCGPMPFQPCVDGELLSDRIVQRWKDGAAKDLNMMIGYTRDEDLYFFKMKKRILAAKYVFLNEEGLLQRIKRVFGSDAMGVKNSDEVAVKGR